MRKKTSQTEIPFSELQSKTDFIIGVAGLIVIFAGGVISVYYGFKYIGIGLSIVINWLSAMASKLDAVIIVALITGAVSITGVIISSIIGKIIEYKKSRQEYLAKKREEPYTDFIDMIYKVLQNTKEKTPNNEQDMIDDISRFSKNITLWGSPQVVKKWVKFRENGMNPETAEENVFLIEEIMNEMRKDLGLKKVKKGNLLAFFINDIKNVIENKQKKVR